MKREFDKSWVGRGKKKEYLRPEPITEEQAKRNAREAVPYFKEVSQDHTALEKFLKLDSAEEISSGGWRRPRARLLGKVVKVKFGYRDTVKEVMAGTPDALGGVYFDFISGNIACQVIAGKAFEKDQAAVTGLNGRWAVIDARIKNRRLLAEEIVPVEDLAQGKFGGLSFSVLKGSAAKLNGLRKRTLACTECDLRQQCKAPVPITRGELELVIAGEAPGGQEDGAGRAFIGHAGGKLRKELKANALDPAWFHFTNIVHCRPPSNKLDPKFVKLCPWLAEEIKVIQPKAVFLAGRTAMKWYNPGLTSIKEVNGTVEFSERFNCYVAFGIHPAAVLHDPANGPEFRAGVRAFAELVQALAG